MSAHTSSCDYLFISPHLDDAVLSCALKMLKARQDGKSVMVATLFSQGWIKPDGQDLYDGRHHEDAMALKTLGITDPIHLGFSDAPFRHSFYSNFKSVVLSQHPADHELSQELNSRVGALCEELAPTTVFLPLAIGTHIDHRLTHQTWRTLSPKFDAVFYEDRPYCFLPNSLALRFIEIQASISKTAAAANTHDSEVLQSLFEGLTTVTMYKTLLVNKTERFRYMLYAARKLNSPPALTNLSIEPEMVSTTATEEWAKIQAAVSSYKSQIPMLYKDLDIFTKESMLYARSLNANSIYAERYWKLVHDSHKDFPA